MRTRIKLLLVLLICLVPQYGCRFVRTITKRSTTKTELKRTVDSTAMHRFDSAASSSWGKTESLDEIMKRHQAAVKQLETDINYRRETVTRPVTVPGKTYEFTANWILDTAATGGGVITYFAADQPDLSASISRDSAGRMKVKIQTKDQVIDMPAEAVTFSSKQSLKSDSSTYNEQTRQAIKSDSGRQSVATSGYDSGHVEADLEQKAKEKIADDSSTRMDTRSLWLFLSGIVVLVVVYLGFRFGWIAKLFTFLKSKK